MSYRTQAQMRAETEQAKACSILLIAEHFGYSLKKHGNCYQSQNETGLTFFPNTNSFYRFYENYGGSGIDFVMKEMGCSIGEAVAYINTNISYTSTKQVSVSEPTQYEPLKSSKDLLVPPKHTDNRRVFAYLNKSRGISSDIISNFLHRHLLYEQADKHNAIFVGYDKEMKPQHCFMRGTISGVQYRGDTYGSNKEYGFTVLADEDKGENQRLIVFEAPIDLMSYKTLYPNDDCDMLALGMLSLEPVYTFLKDYPNKSISFVLDCDEPGLKAMQQFSEELTSKGYKVESHLIIEKMLDAKVKDVNELLLHTQEQVITKDMKK